MTPETDNLHSHSLIADVRIPPTPAAMKTSSYSNIYKVNLEHTICQNN